MSELIKNIVVVGGGTAGWLTACNLAKQLNVAKNDTFSVTVVESPDIPTIGVGEGTWPTMRKTLHRLGIDEAEFLVECDATFKHGTKFVNWRKSPQQGNKEFYYNLFTSFVDPTEFNLAPYWNLGIASKGLSYPEAVSIQQQVCERGLAPKLITTPAYDGILSYAYSLNAGKFGKMLNRVAVNQLGVNHKLANVESVLLNDQGYIESVSTDREGEIHGDFFVDCTGAKALLIGEALGIDFEPFSDTILTNQAIFMQVPYKGEDSPIVPCTVSTAQECGWTWDIGLTNRRGVGYVYSDQYSSPDRAEQVLRDYIGSDADNINAKHIKVNVGQRKKSFYKNCLALGMSAAFVEPLEASAIFLIEAGSNMLADMFPRHKSALAQVEQTYNESFNYRWSKTVEFIKMHYFLSQRDDNQFWLDNRDLNTVPKALLQRLNHWKTQPISRYDFPNSYEPFTMESYQYIYYGMLDDVDFSEHASSFGEREKAKKIFASIEATKNAVMDKLPSHRELINTIRIHGLQGI